MDSGALNDLFNYYKFFDPKIDWNTGGFVVTRNSSDGTKRANTLDVTNEIYEVYINNIIKGERIIGISQVGFFRENNDGLYFNTVTQKKGSEEAQFLSEDYWTHYPGSGATSRAQKSQPVLDRNFYSSVCGVPPTMSTTPPVDFTINILRSPLLTCARQNVESIEMFLNYMPSYFPSNMIPYLDAEFQIRKDFDNEQYENKSENSSEYLRSPSLLRFLMGSIDVKNIALTEADKSLSQVVTTPTTENAQSQSNFFGMEMFTTPQTLTNMDNLTATAANGRINDAKPFVPPATLNGANITIVNAGAGDFAHRTANIEIKIHDKSRFVEFSEFIRGTGVGYSKGRVIVWLTYGWIAPRNASSEEQDFYSKFINENMLVREAYTIKNTSFSFDQAGEVTLTLELVSAAMTALEANSLEAATPESIRAVRNSFDDIQKIINTIKEKRYSYGAPSEGMEEFRIYQVLESATDGELEPDIDPKELRQVLAITLKQLESGQTYLKGKQLQEAKDLIKNVQLLYGQGKNAGEKLRDFRKTVFNYATTRMKATYDGSGADPFLPSHAKSNYFGKELVELVEATLPEIPEGQASENRIVKYISKEDYDKLKADIQASKKRVVSFGKIFCVFCLPSILKSCADEGIDEVQVNFYQFNESCGPLRYHNIAEFPVDIMNFMIQFESFIERRGGASMTISQFLDFFIETQILDNRSLAYGMTNAYEPFTVEGKREEIKNQSFETKMSAWSTNYGEFKRPVIAIKTECKPAYDVASSNVDLLNDLAADTASYYAKDKKGMIKRVHIYDKSCNIYGSKSRKIITNDAGQAVSVNTSDPAFVNLTKISDEQIASQVSGKENTFQSTQSVPFDMGRNVLRNYMESVPLNIPTIEHGLNGTLVSNASVTSKADGLLGAIYMQGGSFKASSKLTNNGLAMAANNLPMRVIPGQLTVSTMGVPIADLYQTFFVDFGTGTTLDNIYSATGVSHSITPGKFETSWTFAYTDGYGKFYTPLPVNEFVKLIKEEAQDEASAESKKTSPKK